MKKRAIIIMLVSMIFVVCSVNAVEAKGKAKIEKCEIIQVYSKKARQATIKWKKIKNISGYEIKYSTNRKFKNSKIIKISKKRTKKTIKNLKQGKKYYIKIRGVNKKSKGKWSIKKSTIINDSDKKYIELINSKTDFKLSSNARIKKFTNIESEYNISGEKYNGCVFLTKVEISEKEFKKIKAKIGKNEHSSYMLFESYAIDCKWWDLKKSDVKRSHNYFNNKTITIKVDNKQEYWNIRGIMEVYLSKNKSSGNRLLYICYQGV